MSTDSSSESSTGSVGAAARTASAAIGPRGRPLHLLVTAGPTREKIDEVREWGNIFTGKTGLDLAMAFLDLGSVTLLTSNEAHARDFDGFSGKAGMLGTEVFRSHGDLLALLRERVLSGAGTGGVDVVAMTAAVADYQPEGVFRIVSKREGGSGRELWEVENVTAGKVKSTHEEIAVRGRRTLKLIDQFRGAWHYDGLLIKFKLEVGLSDEELIRVAGASRLASGADLMVANTLAMARGAGESGGAFLIDDAGTARVERSGLAGAIAGWVRSRVG
jgi:phosphopantothenoylcysteine synthetase/decarboxylase